jgi:hypothetical protein
MFNLKRSTYPFVEQDVESLASPANAAVPRVVVSPVAKLLGIHHALECFFKFENLNHHVVLLDVKGDEDQEIALDPETVEDRKSCLTD